MSLTLTIHFVDGDIRTRAEGARLALARGCHAEVYASVGEITKLPPRDGIVVVRDMLLPGGATEVLAALSSSGVWLPVVISSEDGAVPRVVEAIRAGAIDYLLLPLDSAQFNAMVERAAPRAKFEAQERRRTLDAQDRIAGLSDREREVLALLVDGGSNKQIARELDISPRTVEIHRANMMEKLGARHVAQAVRLSIEAGFLRKSA